MRQVIGKGMLATAAASSILSLSGSSAFAAGGDAVAANSPGILSGNSVQAPVEVPVNACGNSANVVGVGNPAMGNNCANAGASDKEHSRAPERTVTQERGGARTDDGAGYGSDDDHTPGRDSHSGSHGSHPGTHAGTQSLARSEATNSPGILSGNNAQAPADVPVNACGNTVDVIGLLNPTGGNSCSNGAPAPKPPRQETPPSTELPPEAETTPRVVPPTDRAMPPVKAGQPPQDVASSTSASRLPSVAHEVQHAGARLAATGGDQDLLTAAAASAALLVGGGILYRRGRASSGR
ncbi:chaplin [Streptomyces sp. Je 1-332]|uniref:chaplin n=1 Tax=Streptomyces sp. Je 1-332 TaxID=3231270 RepID=UPI0034587C86